MLAEAPQVFGALPLPANITIFAAAAVVVWIAGTKLARDVDALASITGMRHAFLGMVVLGGVTSLPEFAIAVTATVRGTPVLTVNDLLGSAAANVVILAIADAVIGRDALTSVQGSPEVMLQGVLGVMLMALVVAPSVAGDTLVLGMGGWTWALLATYVVAIGVVATSKSSRAWRPINISVEDDEHHARDEKTELRAIILRLIAAGAAILGAGFVLTTAGETIAEQSGIGAGFFAVVFIAIATSLPEVSTVLAAVRLRRYSMAIADVLGTNLVNVTIIVLVDALHGGGPVLLEVGRWASVSALLALLLTSVFLVGLLERRDRTVLRMGIDSLVALLVYAGGIALLYNLR